ncbi:GATA transcription factor 4 [Fagus crenata]
MVLVQSDDVAELELSGGGARTKHSKAPTTTLTSSLETGKSKPKSKTGGDRGSPEAEGKIRRCTHCASEKTPQWRMGPMGPKTLCDASGLSTQTLTTKNPGALSPEGAI